MELPYPAVINAIQAHLPGCSGTESLGLLSIAALWLMQEDLIVDDHSFPSQHPIMMLDPAAIVFHIQAASQCTRPNRTDYGRLMIGPSITADAEATLVHGAQGTRSLNLSVLPP